MKKITVFTPTYNRAHTLTRLYTSLCHQKNKDFIWLVVDDGSTDGTEELIKKFQSESLLEIRYFYKKNEGLCSGYNTAIEKADTELMICIDSDDYASENMIDIILDEWNKYKDDKNCTGLVGLNCTPQNEVLGGERLETGREYNDLVFRKGQIDRKFVVRTEYYKKVAPWPIIEGEKAMNPNFMNMELCRRGYRFREVDKILCVVDYQEYGMSHSVWNAYYNSAKSFAMMRKYNLDYGIMPFSRKIVLLIHYNSSIILSKNFIRGLKESKFKILTLLTAPAGWMLSQIVKLKNKI